MAQLSLLNRISSRLTENVLEHSRDLGLSAADLLPAAASGSSGAGASRYLDSISTLVSASGRAETVKLLSSRRDDDRLEGLRRAVAVQVAPSAGGPAAGANSEGEAALVPLVLSLLSSHTTPPTLQVRHLISAFLLYALSVGATREDDGIALLCINTYTRDLSDPSPLVRADALRVLARVASLSAARQGGGGELDDLLVPALARSGRDSSWYVRREAGSALAVFYSSSPSPSRREVLVREVLHREGAGLLGQATPLTLGAAVGAWEALYPAAAAGDTGTEEGWELIHPRVRSWVALLPDVEEWGQVRVLSLLGRYARLFFPAPTAVDEDEPWEGEKDRTSLLKAAKHLWAHANPSVSLAALRVSYSASPREKQGEVVAPLLRVLGTAQSQGDTETGVVVLRALEEIAGERPELLSSKGVRERLYPSYGTGPASGSATAGRANSGTEWADRAARVRILGLLAEAAASVDGSDDLSELTAELEFGLSWASGSTSPGAGGKAREAFLKACVNGLGKAAKQEKKDGGRAWKALGRCLAPAATTAATGAEAKGKGSTTSVRELALAAIEDVLLSASPEQQQRTSILSYLVSLLAAPTALAATQELTSSAKEGIYLLLSRLLAASPSLLSTSGTGLRQAYKEALRLGALSFASQTARAKVALLGLAARVLVLVSADGAALGSEKAWAGKLWAHVALLARYDLSFGVRDRARFLAGLVAGFVVHSEEKEGGTVQMDEEAWRSGVEVADLLGEQPNAAPHTKEDQEAADASDKLGREHAYRVLFPAARATQAASLPRSDFGPTFAALLASEKGDRTEGLWPPFKSRAEVPPHSIRDPPAAPTSTQTPQQRVGSPPVDGAFLRPGALAGVGGAGPGSRSASPFRSGQGTPAEESEGRRKGFRDLNDFLGATDDESEDEEGSEEEESEDEETDEDEDETESEEESSEDELVRR